jgi:hypothetical protein
MKLSAQQAKAVAALVSGDSQEVAATTAGVSRSTLTRWMRDPTFEQALEAAINDLSATLFRRLSSFAAAALGVTGMLMMNELSPATVRLAAARTLLDGYLRQRELYVLEVRMSRIEKLLTQEVVEDDGEEVYDDGQE